MILNTDWTEITSPLSIPLAEIRPIPGLGRALTARKVQRQEESFNTIGIAPTPVRLVNCNYFNDSGDTASHYYIADGHANFRAALQRGDDPREVLALWVAPEEKTTPHEIAQLIVYLNRAETQATLEAVARAYSGTNPDCAHLVNLTRTFRNIGAGTIAAMLDPVNTIDAVKNNLERGTFAITNPNGDNAVEMFGRLLTHLETQRRQKLLNPAFGRELSRRFMVHNYTVNYGSPGRLPRRPRTPNAFQTVPTGTPRVVGNVIQFRPIITAVLSNETDFPPIPWGPSKGDRDNWNNDILTRMGILP